MPYSFILLILSNATGKYIFMGYQPAVALLRFNKLTVVLSRTAIIFLIEEICWTQTEDAELKAVRI